MSSLSYAHEWKKSLSEKTACGGADARGGLARAPPSPGIKVKTAAAAVSWPVENRNGPSDEVVRCDVRGAGGARAHR